MKKSKKSFRMYTGFPKNQILYCANLSIFVLEGLFMKFSKKFINILFIFGFIFSFGLVSAEGNIISIASPNNQMKDRYYIAQRQSPSKFYVEQKKVSTDEKEHGAFIERVGDNYLIYDDDYPSESFTHIIKKIDDYHYIVGIHYPIDEITPVLEITRDFRTSSNWYIKSLNTFGRICMPSSEVYIEKLDYYNTWYIKSAVASADIDEGVVYNCVTADEKPDEEFSTIVNFFAAFIFK